MRKIKATIAMGCISSVLVTLAAVSASHNPATAQVLVVDGVSNPAVPGGNLPFNTVSISAPKDTPESHSGTRYGDERPVPRTGTVPETPLSTEMAAVQSTLILNRAYAELVQIRLDLAAIRQQIAPEPVKP